MIIHETFLLATWINKHALIMSLLNNNSMLIENLSTVTFSQQQFQRTQQ